MISKKIEKAFNDQIQAELFSAYLYLAMSAYFTAENLEGMAHWMRMQTQEEVLHAMKMYDYLAERDGRPVLQPVDAPPKTWKSPLAVFEAAFKHEQLVTRRINTMADLALAEKDHATHTFLQWFVNEQVEEESVASGIVAKLKMVKDFGGGIYMMDQELAGRAAPTPPAASE
jgi:ferritin